MSNPIEILAKVRQAGGTVQAVDGDLRISVPAGTITDENRAVLSEAKADLVRLLAPADPEREAIQWSDTPAADQALDQARREWAEIVGRGPHDCLDRFGDPTLTNAERQHDRNAWANRARLRRRAKTGTGGTEKDLVFREIELILEETFAEHGIEIEAGADKLIIRDNIIRASEQAIRDESGAEAVKTVTGNLND